MRGLLTICVAAIPMLSMGCRSGAAPVHGPEGPAAGPAADSGAPELALSSSTAEVLSGIPEVRVGRTAISVDGAVSVPLPEGATSAVGGAAGEYLIGPLHDRLLAASATEGPADSQRRISVSPHRLTSYRVLTEVLYTAARAGHGPYQLVVRDEGGARRALHVCVPATRLPARGLSACWAPPGSSHLVAFGASGASGLNLMLIVTDQGFRTAASGDTLPGASPSGHGPVVPVLPGWGVTCPRATSSEYRAHGLGPPPCAYDFEELGRVVREIHTTFPEERAIIVSAESSISWEVLAAVLDTIRGPGDESWFPLVLFSIAVG